MSKSITLIVSEAAKFYQEHMGLNNTLKREARMEREKISYQPFSLELFDRPQIEFQEDGGSLDSYHLIEGMKVKNNVGIFPAKQMEALSTLGHLCWEMGYRIELGELHTTGTSLAIPVYIVIDDHEDHDTPVFESYDPFSHEGPFPDFSRTAASFDNPLPEMKSLPPFEESLTLDAFFQGSAIRIEKEKIRVKIKGDRNE